MTTSGKTLAQMREEYASMALLDLRDKVIPTLEKVIAGTPTGERREALSEAYMILQLVLDNDTKPTAPIRPGAARYAAMKARAKAQWERASS